VTAQTTKNCWRKFGLLLNPATTADVAQDDVDAFDSAADTLSDTLADTDEQHEADPALLELANAIENLQAMQRGLLPEGQRLTSAEEIVELEGENEVFEELEDVEIVSLQMSQGIDKTDSEEDAEANNEACNVTASQAVFYAQQLEMFTLGNPKMFTAEQSLAHANIRRDVKWRRLSGMR
jgi:hypothetical protein